MYFISVGLIYYSFIIIAKHRFLKMEGSSSGTQSRSKKKNKPVGPIKIHTDGKPFGTHYDALADSIARHVTHCDEFSPVLSWPEHKNAGRVQRLYMELTVSYLAY
jgi:hypothetical protein